MKTSGAIALAAFAFGFAVAALLYVPFPRMPWWLYAIIAMLIAGPTFRIWLEMVSNASIIDRGAWPRTKPTDPTALDPMVKPVGRTKAERRIRQRLGRRP